MSVILRKGFLLLACCFALLTPCHAGTDLPFNFLALADIHFDPFTVCYKSSARPCPLLQRLRTAPASEWPQILSTADTDAARYRYDTNYVLLKESLREAAVAAKEHHAVFVLVLGDTLGHDLRRYYKKYAKDNSQVGFQAFAKKLLEFVNAELAAAFADISVFMITGNNDTYSLDYQSAPGGDFYHDAGAVWSTLIKNPDDAASMRREFLAAGYYAVDVPRHADIRLIALNTVLFSEKSRGKLSAAAAEVELSWLHQELEQARDRHQRVLLALHIPPKLDAFATRRWRLFTIQQFWQPVYLQRFQNELAEFYPEIIDIIAGHLHYDWTQELPADYRHNVTVRGVPSISPIFGNDTSFKMYHYTPDVNRIDSFDTYILPVQGGGVWSVQHSVD